jgi:hypothetical protein
VPTMPYDSRHHRQIDDMAVMAPEELGPRQVGVEFSQTAADEMSLAVKFMHLGVAAIGLQACDAFGSYDDQAIASRQMQGTNGLARVRPNTVANCFSTVHEIPIALHGPMRVGWINPRVRSEIG